MLSGVKYATAVVQAALYRLYKYVDGDEPLVSLSPLANFKNSTPALYSLKSSTAWASFIIITQLRQMRELINGHAVASWVPLESTMGRHSYQLKLFRQTNLYQTTILLKCQTATPSASITTLTWKARHHNTLEGIRTLLDG